MRALERQYKTAEKTGTGGASTAGERNGRELPEAGTLWGRGKGPCLPFILSPQTVSKTKRGRRR